MSSVRRMAGESDRSIAGRVAVVTGAASGMGRAVAELFAEEGAQVAACDRNDTALAEVVDGIRAVGGTAHAFPLDVTDAAAVAEAVTAAVDALGRRGDPRQQRGRQPAGADRRS